MSQENIYQKFNKAFSASTPLISINCFDPAATIESLKNNLRDSDSVSIIQWDCINGWKARNQKGLESITTALQGQPIELTISPVENLKMIELLPEKSIVFILNGHLFFKDDPQYLQAFWNLRDICKLVNISIVLLTSNFILPSELQQDVLVLNEALPDEPELEKIIRTLCEENEVPLNEKNLKEAINALKGLPAFPAEQSVALSLKKSGLDIDELWARKIQLINDTPGLMVWKDGHKFDDLGGLEEIKLKFRRIIAGKKSPKIVVWIDEIEKAMAGSMGDTSGTSQDQLGVLLSEMQDKDYSGSIFVGVPGAAKSALAKAIGNEANVLTIKLDLGAMKGQYVGVSEERIRRAMKIIEAVGGIGGALFIATSNDIRAIKPELKRRFWKGIWFFDLPTREERQLIWKIYNKKFDLKEKTESINFDTDWTGAEIENCCKIAWEEEIPLAEASKSIIPVSVSGAHQVEMLRTEATGKYSSTNYPGVYNSSIKTETFNLNQKRSKLHLD